MTTTLSEGVKVPDVGSVNWAGDLEVNWNLLNGALANLSGNVKLDRDNVWTGEQSFTLPIVGSIAGTASKAIADEDGTSIKTGYGKLAGNQTWTGTNTYTGASAIRFNNTSYVSGTPSGNIFYSTVQWGGYVNNTWSAPFTINNAIRTNGYNDTSFRTYSQTSNTLTGFVHETNADASDIAFRPIVNGTHSLGSSSYQWSSVYAQTYYYNGTAWGLDKANVWSQNNRIQAFLEMQYLASGGYSDIRWYDENNVNCCTFRQSVNFLTIGKKYTSKSAWYDGAQILITASGAVIFKGYNGANTQSAAFTYDSFYPEQNNAINLGTSTNKWKTINGYEPSMLGEVWVDNAVTIDTTNWLLDGSGWNTLDTSIMSGWVYFAVTDCDADSFILFRRGSNKAKNPTICFHPQHANSGTYYLYGLFMVPKNTMCIVAIKTGTNGVLTQALLYPCFGNV